VAHPHVWVAVRSEIILDADHQITGIRHAWTFDEFYSAMAVQGLDTNGDGVFSAEELKPLAEVNVKSLKDFDYFTFGPYRGWRQSSAEAARELFARLRQGPAHAPLEAAAREAT
jgi:ABC-type uncharacterized transport system substrate-binding protein